MDIHGEFHGQFVSEKGMEEIVKEDTYPYKPNSGQNTEPHIKKSKYGKPVKPRGIDYVKKFTPHTAMEHFLREVLTDESYSNTVAILEDHLMNFVLIGTKHKWCLPCWTCHLTYTLDYLNSTAVYLTCRLVGLSSKE